MEADALITLDDSKHRQAKSYGGLVSNVRDLAKDWPFVYEWWYVR